MAVAVRYKHFSRYREIATVLMEEGFGYLIDEIGLSRFLRASDRLRKRERRSEAQYSLAERARRSLERLGPTFVKVGQILSTRPDLLPEEFEVEFAKLQDQVPPVAFETLCDVIEHELGAPMAISSSRSTASRSPRRRSARCTPRCSIRARRSWSRSSGPTSRA